MTADQIAEQLKAGKDFVLCGNDSRGKHFTIKNIASKFFLFCKDALLHTTDNLGAVDFHPHWLVATAMPVPCFTMTGTIYFSRIQILEAHEL